MELIREFLKVGLGGAGVITILLLLAKLADSSNIWLHYTGVVLLSAIATFATIVLYNLIKVLRDK